MEDDFDAAKAYALELAEIFGPDNFYLELRTTACGPADGEPGAVPPGPGDRLPMVVTNDAHYLRQEDAKIQDVLLCVQTAKTVDDPNRMRFETEEFYIKSEEELRRLFPNAEEAFLPITVDIARRCNVEFVFNQYKLPPSRCPRASPTRPISASCVWRASGTVSDLAGGLPEASEYEIDVISKMGYVNYYLIVWDFIRYAKDSGIPVGPGRGWRGLHSSLLYAHHRSGPHEVHP